MNKQTQMAGWQDISTAPKDGTHILAVLYREACEDMDGFRRAAFSEIREIWYRPYHTLGMYLPWHAGDPFDSHDGMAPEHMGEAVPVRWMPITLVGDLLAALRETASAIGEWSRPTSTNGMTCPSLDHPLLVAQRSIYDVIALATGEASR